MDGEVTRQVLSRKDSCKKADRVGFRTIYRRDTAERPVDQHGSDDPGIDRSDASG